METKTKRHLYYLEELDDYKVKSEDPDVRGWTLNDQDSECIGTIENLLVSPDKMKVRYLDVVVDKEIIAADHKPYKSDTVKEPHEYINKEGENHLLVPVGLVSVDKDQKTAHCTEVSKELFQSTKRIRKDSTIDRDFEIQLLDSYNRNKMLPVKYSDDDAFYENDLFRTMRPVKKV